MCGQTSVALENHSDVAVFGITINSPLDRGNSFSVNANFAGVWPLQTSEAAQRRRFAAAGRPEQGHEFPLRDQKANVAHGHLGIKILSEMVKLDHCLAASVHGCTASVRSGSSLR